MGEKIRIIDDCLVPDKFVWLKYSGPDPWDAAKHISGRIRSFFHVSASGTANTRINWDVVGENTSFYSVWWVKKALSTHTMMWIHMKVLGKKSKATNNGNFTFQMNAYLDTTFGGSSIFLKPFYYIYSYIFYNRVRRKMLERCRNSVYSFREDIKKHFNLQPAESVSKATGTYG
jgi:hypothetical protein